MMPPWGRENIVTRFCHDTIFNILNNSMFRITLNLGVIFRINRLSEFAPKLGVKVKSIGIQQIESFDIAKIGRRESFHIRELILQIET